MNKLKSRIAEALSTAGLTVEAGGIWRMAVPVKTEKVCLRILKATAEDGAIYRYLGLNDQGEEQYGMKLTVDFGLVMLTPKSGGGDGAEEYAETVMDLLLTGIGSLKILNISLEEAAYDSVRDCFSQEIRMRIMVLACGTVTDSTVQLEDFRLEATRN